MGGDSTRPKGTQTADRTADRLHTAAIHLLRRLRREDEASGLTAPRLSALSVVVYGGPLTLSALADAEQVRAPTITRVVAALEGSGLVSREADPSDGRAALVRATPEGVRVLGEARTRRLAVLSSEIKNLSPDELATLVRATDILERLIRVPEHR